jgi:hypothetical protein
MSPGACDSSFTSRRVDVLCFYRYFACKLLIGEQAGNAPQMRMLSTDRGHEYLLPIGRLLTNTSGPPALAELRVCAAAFASIIDAQFIHAKDSTGSISDVRPRALRKSALRRFN